MANCFKSMCGSKPQRSGEHRFEEVWQHNEIKFDGPPSALQLRTGEVQIDSFESIEDTKGNAGSCGTLIITNMRLIWTLNDRSNLSIGLDCIVSLKAEEVFSKVHIYSQGLLCKAHFDGTSFEHIFTAPAESSLRLLHVAQAVFENCGTTKLYRDLRVKDDAIIRGKELVPLLHEQVYDKLGDIASLSGSNHQGVLGTLIITNIRTVWFAELSQEYATSIPYLQMERVYVTVRPTGQKALVIETTASSGSYRLGFRSDPIDHVEEVCAQIADTGKAFFAAPIFGVEPPAPPPVEPPAPPPEEWFSI